MCNILNTADRIEERMKTHLGLRVTTVHIGRVLFMPDSFSLVCGHSVHLEKFPMLV